MGEERVEESVERAAKRLAFHHTRYKKSEIRVQKIYIYYRESGEEALGETRLGFLITELSHIIF